MQIKNKTEDMIKMVELPKEIRLEDTPNLKAGFQSPIEIKNNNEEGYKTEIKGIEFWTPVVEEGYEHYWVSTKGRVWNSRSKNLLKGGDNGTGYQFVHIRSKNGIHRNFLRHRLVSLAFIPNPENKETVNHKDGDKKNNHVENLEWMTHKENARHAWHIGLNDKRKITKEQQNEIVSLRKKGWSTVDIAEKLKIGSTTVWDYCRKSGLNERLDKITKEQKELVLTLRKTGLSIMKIGEEIGISTSSVLTICDKEGLGKRIDLTSQEQKNKVIELKKKGETYSNIVQKTSLSLSTVQRICSSNGLCKTKNVVTEELIQQLVKLKNEGMTYTEISKEIGLTVATVSKYIRQENKK
ncbi:MAG TPA: hypothetical protein DEB42_00490 [Jeotgalicoccus sp.]|nr:hypothetical protein [Jeotgalicoccus sp.]